MCYGWEQKLLLFLTCYPLQADRGGTSYLLSFLGCQSYIKNGVGDWEAETRWQCNASWCWALLWSLLFQGFGCWCGEFDCLSTWQWRDGPWEWVPFLKHHKYMRPPLVLKPKNGFVEFSFKWLGYICIQSAWICLCMKTPYTTEFKHCTNIFGLSAADRMCRSGAVDIICIDSVSALTPRAEIEVFFLVYLSRIWANMMSVSSHFFWVCDWKIRMQVFV